MSLHKFIDNFSMSIGSILTRNTRYFSKGVESRKISEWFSKVDVVLPNRIEEGYYPIIAQYEDKKEEAGIRIEQWKGDNYPTIIYHHGAAEGSYDFSFNRILAKSKSSIDANLIAIQALFNHSNKEFMDSIAYLSNYTLMLATSVLIVENLIKMLRKTNKNKVIVTGASLGGFVTNLHFTYYNSADIYKPLLSGARLGETFVNSAYSKVTSTKGKMNAEKLRHVLNFENDLKKRDQHNLYPLMALHDQIVMYNTQCIDFNSNQITSVPYGHATGATKFNILRNHILNNLNN